MKNIEFSQDDNLLHIIVDLSVVGNPSTTGKMQLLANSGGWTVIDQSIIKDQVKFNMTLGYKR